MLRPAQRIQEGGSISGALVEANTTHLQERLSARTADVFHDRPACSAKRAASDSTHSVVRQRITFGIAVFIELAVPEDLSY